MKYARYKATAVLAASAASWAAVTPFAGSFVGSLLQHGFLAATIGGLADWFAVTALFKKPLGISYRTDIIVRNRERIFGELVEFIGNDLLSPVNIMKIVERYDTSQMLYTYMRENSGLEKTQALLNTLAADTVEQLDFQQLAENIDRIIAGDIDKLPSNVILADMLQFALDGGYDSRIIKFVLQELDNVVVKPEFHELLTEVINEIKTRYEGDSSRRQIVSMLLSISSGKLADIAQQKLSGLLAELQNDEHEIRLRLRASFESFVGELRTSAEWNTRINAFLLELCQKHIDLPKECRQYQQRLVSKLRSADSPFNAVIAAKVRLLKEEITWSRRIDRRIKLGLTAFLERQHSIIIGIVQEKLNAFSDAELLDFIEGRVGDDLQMIRINGSLVGGVVGMLLYLLTVAAEEVFG